MLGGRRGLGLMAIKTADGSWSNPVFVKLTGASFGLQAGVQSADVILVFRSERGLDNLVNGKITLGADAGVAAGPVGRNAAAATDGAAEGRDLVVVARARAVRRRGPGRRGAVDRQRRQSQPSTAAASPRG